jgi:ribosomal 50S subunit-associated protein YjgA (DUF615 family)
VGPFLLICYSTERNAVKFIKKVFGEKDVEAVLQRLDRLTQDEARTTAAQTLKVIHGLVQGMRVIMDGEQTGLAYKSAVVEYPTPQTAKHLLTVSGKPSVRFVHNKEPVLCLTER